MMKPMVSIICNAYNHEKYIAQALDSFLAQKVDFPIEILVHDDASTDGTAQVIRTYAEAHPDVIFPILQTENQRSQGIHVTYDIQVPRARGKYIAFCEGDDYWTDSEKLQMQYDFMESHPEYTACCHAYDMVNADGMLLEHRRDYIGDQDIPFSDLVGNQLEVPHFATFFVQSKVTKACEAVFLGVRSDDMSLRLRCALAGKIRYFDRVMSAYRRFVSGSWTMRVGNQKEQFAKRMAERIEFLRRLNAYTEYRYAEVIEKAIANREFQAALLCKDYRTARKCVAYKTAPRWKRAAISVGCVFPKTMAWAERLREKR